MRHCDVNAPMFLCNKHRNAAKIMIALQLTMTYLQFKFYINGTDFVADVDCAGAGAGEVGT